ncbi:hypothetical protein CC86DRAFT_367446 [Ophiobolus disseminans]|uniref:Mid2 domain-containing protein n=1 Tax=Ophiobolus disseminans TaxID=1469910 RepID=A0A6A7ADI6_9PLEO|nr:hypothetical protein CC86DRAFT_367446 [Ophiobolus disseminans]
MRHLVSLTLFVTLFHRVYAFPDGVGQFSTFALSSLNGSFSFPSTYPLILRANNTYPLAWTTTFKTVNLFLYQRGKAGGYPIAVRQSTGACDWKADTIDADNKAPFTIRGVNIDDNTPGKPKEGDFFSAMFYIAREPGDVFSTEPSSTPTGISSLSATATATGNALSASASKKSKKRKKTLGLGLGISLGVIVLLLVILGGLALLKRRRKRAAHETEKSAAATDGEAAQGSAEMYAAPAPQEIYTKPSEVEGERRYVEMPVTERAVEMSSEGGRGRT